MSQSKVRRMPRVALLAGGVGGAKMARGLAHVLPKNHLTVIGNVADDEKFYGLQVCPDIDTLLYTLSGQVNKKQGWGIRGDKYRAQKMLSKLQMPTWMKLGDSDLGLHIWRTQELLKGKTLTDIIQEASTFLKTKACVLPATDQAIRTIVNTKEGSLRFQEWFVREKCLPYVLSLSYKGLEAAEPTVAVLSAIEKADLIVIAPSNPWLSIAPIIGIQKIKNFLLNRKIPCIAVSPLVGQKALKGPLVKVMANLGLSVSLETIAKQYEGLIDCLVIDYCDETAKNNLTLKNLRVTPTNIVMSSPVQAMQLAKTLIAIFTHHKTRLGLTNHHG